jgi:hypothetical protein
LKKIVGQQLKQKGLNCNDSSFQVLGAVGNLSFGKFRRCFHESELSRWKSCSGKSLDSICGTNEQTNERTNCQTNQMNRASKHPYIKTRKVQFIGKAGCRASKQNYCFD